MKDWTLPDIDLDLCTGCGDCVAFCQTKAVELGPDGLPVILRPEACTYCGVCEERCPEGAVALAYELVRPVQER